MSYSLNIFRLLMIVCMIIWKFFLYNQIILTSSFNWAIFRRINLIEFGKCEDLLINLTKHTLCAVVGCWWRKYFAKTLLFIQLMSLRSNFLKVFFLVEILLHIFLSNFIILFWIFRLVNLWLLRSTSERFGFTGKISISVLCWISILIAILRWSCT